MLVAGRIVAVVCVVGRCGLSGNVDFGRRSLRSRAIFMFVPALSTVGVIAGTDWVLFEVRRRNKQDVGGYLSCFFRIAVHRDVVFEEVRELICGWVGVC